MGSYINFPFFGNFGMVEVIHCEHSEKFRHFITNYMTLWKNDLFILGSRYRIVHALLVRKSTFCQKVST